MTRNTLTVVVAALVALGPQDVLFAQRGSRGSSWAPPGRGRGPPHRGREPRAHGTCPRPATATTALGRSRPRAGLRRASSGPWTPTTRASSAPRPRLRPGASRPRAPARPKVRVAMRRSRAAGAPAPAARPPARASPAATPTANQRWRAASTPSTTAATPASPPATRVAAIPAPRSVRTGQGHHHPPVRLSHDDLPRTFVLRVWRRLLSALHARRRALLLPGATAVLRLLQQSAGGGYGPHDRGCRLPDVTGRQLQQADHEQRRQGGLSSGAGAARRADSRPCPPHECWSRSPASPTTCARTPSIGASWTALRKASWW